MQFSLRALLDDLYYRWKPEALLEEALDYLQLNFYEQAIYAATGGDLLRKWAILVWITKDRIRMSPDEAHNYTPLLRALFDMGQLRGWISAYDRMFAGTH